MDEVIIKAAKLASDSFGNDKHAMLWYHTKTVLKISLAIFSKYFSNDNLNRDAMIIGCYLHDIGMPKSKKNHPEMAKDMAEEFFKENKIKDKKLKEIVFDIILNHDTEGRPTTKEGLIVCSANNISLLDEATVLQMLYQSHKDKSLLEASNELRNEIELKYLSVPLMEAKKFANQRYKKMMSVLSFLQ